MRSRAMSMILIASAAACAPSAPSTRPSPADVPPVRALLGERDKLSLSSEQVVALDSISRETDVKDRAVGRRLGIIKGGLVPRLGLGKQQPDRALALVAGSHGAAMQAVQQLLRPDQRQRLCELQREREDKAALREDKRSLAGHTLASSRARRSEGRRTWPWCSSTPSRASNTAQSES
ncbi:MAG TPA: hypothetical protein VEQ60_05450 [Longimicrobium sp.]|nr:hypothetical protein [Longimicrobium sp.]